MNLPSGGIERLGGGWLPVSPSAIEDELARLWSRADGDGTEPAVLVRVLNLVAVAFDQQQAEQATEVLEEVAGCHPSRGIVVQVTPDVPPAEIRASISACCRIDEEGRQVCGEEVLLQGHPDGTQAMSSSVASLLVPDLPTVLWWPPGLPADHLYEDLTELCDRLILDSASLSPTAASFGALSLAVRAGGLAMSDLNWARLLACRSLTAQFFDNPAYRPYLDAISRLEIEATGASTQPLLFLGWLASRLDWSPVDARQERDGMRIVLASGLRAVEAWLPAASAAAGRLAVLRLRSEAPGRSLFEIVCLSDTDCGTVRAEIRGEEVEHRSVELPPAPIGTLLCHELEQVGREPVFEEALAGALQLAQLIEGE